MALQIETWCHLQQIYAVGFNVSLSEVCWESVRSQSGFGQESVRSHSGVNQESIRSQSGVNQESVRSQSEIRQESDGIQIWWADLKSSPNLES